MSFLVSFRQCRKCSNRVGSNRRSCMSCGANNPNYTGKNSIGSKVYEDPEHPNKVIVEEVMALRSGAIVEQRSNLESLPPIRARRLQDWIYHPARRRELMGDVDEMYPAQVEKYGQKGADRWYWWMTISPVLPLWRRFFLGGWLLWFWEKFSS